VRKWPNITAQAATVRIRLSDVEDALESLRGIHAAEIEDGVSRPFSISLTVATVGRASIQFLQQSLGLRSRRGPAVFCVREMEGRKEWVVSKVIGEMG